MVFKVSTAHAQLHWPTLIPKSLSIPWDNVALLLVIMQWLLIIAMPPQVMTPGEYHGTFVLAASLFLLGGALLLCLPSCQHEWNKRNLLISAGCLGVDLSIAAFVNLSIQFIVPNSNVFIYGDSIGCVIAAILLGTRWGMAVALLRVFILTLLVGPAGFSIAAVPIIIVWCAGKFRELGGMSSIHSSLIPGFIAGALSVFMETPLTLRLSGDVYYSDLPINQHLTEELKFQIFGFFQNHGPSLPLEKALSFVLSYVVADAIFHLWRSHQESNATDHHLKLETRTTH